jgi:hypothetical protein
MITIQEIYQTLHPVAQQIGEATAAGTALTVGLASLRSLPQGSSWHEQSRNWENYSLGAFVAGFTLIPGVDFSNEFHRIAEYAGAVGTGAIGGGTLRTASTAWRHRELGIFNNQPQRALEGAWRGALIISALYGLIEYFGTR